MGSRQLDRICLSERDIFPQGQCVTLSGESSQSGHGPGWHFRLQRWFPQDSFLSHIPPQKKYFEDEDSLVHGTSRTSFPQWHSAEEYYKTIIFGSCHNVNLIEHQSSVLFMWYKMKLLCDSILWASMLFVSSLNRPYLHTTPFSATQGQHLSCIHCLSTLLSSLVTP
jgi:hypothetical protein